MIGLVILLVLVLLVLAVAFLRLGAAAGYDETGGWVKVQVGPAWLTLYPLSEEKKRKREAKAEKKAAKKKKRTAEPQENKKTPRRKTLKNAFSPGGALDLALDYQIESPRLTVEAACSISVAQLLSILWPILKEAIRGLWKRKKTGPSPRTTKQHAAAMAAQGKEETHGKESSRQ